MLFNFFVLIYSKVLPQVIAPVIAGAVLNTMKKKYTVNQSYGVFFIIVFMWFLLAFIYTYLWFYLHFILTSNVLHSLIFTCYFIQAQKGRTNSNSEDTKMEQSQSIALLHNSQ